MILAGDIGGTKTNLGMFDLVDGSLESTRQQSFPSKGHGGLEDILNKFLTDDARAVTAACHTTTCRVSGMALEKTKRAPRASSSSGRLNLSWSRASPEKVWT